MIFFRRMDLTNLDRHKHNYILNEWFDMHHVPGDGNCLFESISILLSRKVSSMFLRNLVAKRFLDIHDIEATHVLFNWITNYKNNQKDENYKHIENIDNVFAVSDIEHIQMIHRIQCYLVVMTNKFWGEEFSLITIMKYFKIRFAIIDSNKLTFQKLDRIQRKTCDFSLEKEVQEILYDILKKYLMYIPNTNVSDPIFWLYLENRHYSPLLLHSSYSCSKSSNNSSSSS